MLVVYTMWQRFVYDIVVELAAPILSMTHSGSHGYCGKWEECMYQL